MSRLTLQDISIIIQEEIEKIENFKKRMQFRDNKISREKIKEIIREEIIRQELIKWEYLNLN